MSLVVTFECPEHRAKRISDITAVEYTIFDAIRGSYSYSVERTYFNAHFISIKRADYIAIFSSNFISNIYTFCRSYFNAVIDS